MTLSIAELKFQLNQIFYEGLISAFSTLDNILKNAIFAIKENAGDKKLQFLEKKKAILRLFPLAIMVQKYGEVKRQNF